MPDNDRLAGLDGGRTGTVGHQLRRQDLIGSIALVAAGLAMTIALLGVLRPFGFWLGTVVPGVMVSALWIGLLLDAAVRFELVAAAGLQNLTRGLLTAFFGGWMALGLTLHLGAAAVPAPAIVATMLIWRRSWPETWPEFRHET